MNPAATTVDFAADRGPQSVGTAIRLAAVDEPGTYICNWSGHVLRVTEADVESNRFASVPHAAIEPHLVTRISPDPHISRLAAKTLASSFGLATNF